MVAEFFASVVFACGAQPVGLGEVFAPTVVGAPPTCACNEMCVLDDGEIRHYGSQMQDGKVVRVYVSSRDDGLSWKTFRADDKDVGAMVKSPYSGEWISLRGATDGSFACLRSKTGPGDVAPERIVLPWKKVYARQILPLRSRQRWVATIVDVACANGECYHAAVGLSDDDGRTWKYIKVPPVRDVARLAPGDKRPHWFCNGTEPSVAELSDGTLLLVVRTSGPHAAFYRSSDGGETWSEGKPDPRFWQANTMPLLFRMRNGRLLFFWNNTQMLPTRDAAETPELGPTEADGTWEAVFTNRDALHAAYSDDDGKTWRGFREVALCEIRNRPDFRELGNDPAQELDKSVHQTQAVELPGGKVLLAYGQNSSARRMAIFDPKWLEETARKDDFRQGLENLSTHLYLKSHSGGARGWAGHCCWNRLPGAALVRNPDLPLTNRGEVLQLARIRDPRLVCDRQGIVWNFPAARKGKVGVNVRVPGEGFRLTLADHWINPCDETNPALSPVSVPFTSKELPCAKPIRPLKDWHDLVAEWNCEKGTVVFSVDGKCVRTEKMAWVPEAGLSYLHLQALAEGDDPDGAQVRVFWAEGDQPATDGLPRAAADEATPVRSGTLDWFLNHEYGIRPAAAEKPDVSFAPAADDRVMLDGKAVRKTIRCTYRGPYATNHFDIVAFVPLKRGKVPSVVLIDIWKDHERTDPDRLHRHETWPVEELVDRGYAAISFYYGQLAPETYVPEKTLRSGVFAAYERYEDRTPASWGALSVWAWGASRVMDWIEREGALDAAKVMLVGHSRGGKTALLAGVTDSRFAAIVSNNSGTGGARLNRMNLPFSEPWQAFDYWGVSYWFCGNYRETFVPYNGMRVEHDQDEWLSLIAPRGLAVGSGAEDKWAGPAGEQAAARKASEAWKAAGKPNGILFFLREGGHALTHGDWARYLDFADSCFSQHVN